MVHPWLLKLLPVISLELNIIYLSESFTNHDWCIISVQILPSLQKCLLIGAGWNSVIPWFVFASAVSEEQPVLVCLVVWELLSDRWCQSTWGSFMKWWQMHDTATLTAHYQKCRQVSRNNRVSQTHLSVVCKYFFKWLPFFKDRRWVDIWFSVLHTHKSLTAPRCKCGASTWWIRLCG